MILKVVSESHVTWATYLPILVFLGLSVLELGQMYATNRQTDVRRQTKASLNASPYGGGGIIMGIETGGTWDHQAVELVQEIGRRTANITGDARESTFLFQQLSVAQ